MSGAPTQHTSARHLPIAEHGLIGDLRTAALVGTDGTTEWYCCPRHAVCSVVRVFGHARGFGSTKEEYVDWLIERLERVGEPVDLVGRDRGCILTRRVAFGPHCPFESKPGAVSDTGFPGSSPSQRAAGGRS